MSSNASSDPHPESERLAALARLEILDTLPEQAYDDLTRLASQVCRTPIAVFALIDADRQWYKSSFGIGIRETALDVSFCAHAIREPDRVFTVADTATDPRFANNPLVTGEPNIRFYAGAPIVASGGHPIGALCVIDTAPRTLDEGQYDCLRALARHASLLLDLREKAIASEKQAHDHEKQSVEARIKQKRGMELLELVLRGGQMGLWDLDVKTGVWTVNAREHVMLGYAGVEAPTGPLDWRSLVHPDDWPVLEEAMEPHINGRTAFYECTHRMRHAAGHFLWVVHRGVIVERNVRGEALRIVGTHVDVTGSREKDEAGRRDAQRLELCLSGGDHGLWDWHVPSDRIVRNAQWARLFGLSPAEVASADSGGALWHGLVHPEDRTRALAAMDSHLRGLTPMFECEVRMRHRDGSELWVLDRAKVVERDASGRPLRVAGTNFNITDRKRAELALAEANALLVRTGRLARVGGWAVDLERRVVLWSEQVYAIHEVPMTEVPTLDEAIAFFLPDARLQIAAAIDACQRQGTPWDLELPLVTRAGKEVWIRTQGEVEVGDGQVVGLFGTAQDITARKVAEQRRIDSERQLRLVTDHLPALIARVDAQERYTFVNRAVAQVFGVERDSLLGKTMREVRDARGEKSYASIAPHVALALAGRRVVFEDDTQVRGRPYFYQTHYAPDIAADGTVHGFYAMTLDVTDRKRAEMRRAESDDRLRGITDNLPALIAEIDTRGIFRFVNETYRTWLGLDPAAVVGRHVGDVFGERDDSVSRQALVRACRGEKVFFEQVVALAAGERCLQTTYVPHVDAAGAVMGVYALTNDITELKDTQHRFDLLARFDPLTGRANRRQFEEKLAEAMARTRRSGQPMAILYLDIDRFKEINDSMGHAAGDAVLVEFGERLQRVLRETDVVARHGGDEFVVLLEDIDGEREAVTAADKLIEAIRPVFEVPGGRTIVTASVGAALYDGGPPDPPALMARADRALYRAKEAGRDRVGLASD